MAAKSESSPKGVKPFWVNLFIVRHIIAIFNLIILVFWQNNFGNESRVQPTKSEMDEIYDIWFGEYRRVSISDIEQLINNLHFHYHNQGKIDAYNKELNGKPVYNDLLEEVRLREFDGL